VRAARLGRVATGASLGLREGSASAAGEASSPPRRRKTSSGDSTVAGSSAYLPSSLAMRSHRLSPPATPRRESSPGSTFRTTTDICCGFTLLASKPACLRARRTVPRASRALRPVPASSSPHTRLNAAASAMSGLRGRCAAVMRIRDRRRGIPPDPTGRIGARAGGLEELIPASSGLDSRGPPGGRPAAPPGWRRRAAP
jgi:hypothetical protein